MAFYAPSPSNTTLHFSHRQKKMFFSSKHVKNQAIFLNGIFFIFYDLIVNKNTSKFQIGVYLFSMHKIDKKRDLANPAPPLFN